ncbi:MAG: hypothetical protein ACLSAH_04085 [Bilophila wadsworthia]
MLAAAIPAFYIISLLMAVHFEARKLGLKGLSPTHPAAASLRERGICHPLIVLLLIRRTRPVRGGTHLRHRRGYGRFSSGCADENAAPSSSLLAVLGVCSLGSSALARRSSRFRRARFRVVLGSFA